VSRSLSLQTRMEEDVVRHLVDDAAASSRLAIRFIHVAGVAPVTIVAAALVDARTWRTRSKGQAILADRVAACRITWSTLPIDAGHADPCVDRNRVNRLWRVDVLARRFAFTRAQHHRKHPQRSHSAILSAAVPEGK